MSRSLKPPTYQGSSRHGACQWDSFCARPARFRAHEGGGCGPGAVSSTSNAESILRYFPYAAPFTKSLGFVPNRLSRVSIIAMPFKFTRVLLVSIKLDMSGESGSSSYGVSLTYLLHVLRLLSYLSSPLASCLFSLQCFVGAVPGDHMSLE